MSVLARNRSVVVGVDGSESAMRAAVWAAAVAHRRSVKLRLAHALSNPVYHYSEAAPLFQAEFAEEVERSAHEILDRAERRVRSEFPEVTVSSGTYPGPAGLALTRLSRHAPMVAVGSTGTGTVGSLVTGSTVARVLHRAGCPVTVIRSGTPSPVPDNRPVVVGVDGSELSSLAIAEAVDFATTFDVPLLAVHGWGIGDITGRYSALTMTNSSVVEDEQSVLMAENLAGWRENDPDLQLTTVIERANPSELILKYAHDAQLVVVGSHGHGRLVGALLGSTSQNLLHHVTCPIMICRRAS
ncbi:universal stress protein [Rhodococcus marinonascens]|uniref:universal stress protein n=1 Tax=Rhodococcus marinonascens TaxID=38311 RepID=UPI00093243C6|nr:universal stress protein [Rhodococcus marinonascens]